MNLIDYKNLVDNALQQSFTQLLQEPFSALADGMRYSLLAGGKRLRPALVLEFCRICGGDINKALPAACGIEMLHTYSLIHDDLPAMDNDTLRRGIPTNHVKFGEWQAILAGDALQAEAFLSVLSCDLPAERTASAAAVLAKAAGAEGMCAGQYIDMLWEGRSLTSEELDMINLRKTGALISAACIMGVLLGGGSKEMCDAAESYGNALGLAFQIRDDMLDFLSSNEELGKNVGSDIAENKNTYMVLYGEQKCKEIIEQLTITAKNALRSCFADAEMLCNLADAMAIRKM